MGMSGYGNSRRAYTLLSMTDFTILFLGGAKRVSLAERFIAEGSRRGQNVRIVSYELTGDVPIAGCAEIVVGKRWKDPALYEHLAETVRKHKVNACFPS